MRYEAEVSDLLSEVPSSPRAAADLIRGAFREWVQLAVRPPLSIPQPVGGPPMLANPLQRHPNTLALLALLLVVPSLLFVVFSLLAYQVGVPGLAARMEPIVQAITAPLWVDPFLLLAPFVAFLFALLPLVRVGFTSEGPEGRMTIGVRARAFNLVVVVVCVLLGGLLAGYLMVEFLSETR
jgi:hypothetical protein